MQHAAKPYHVVLACFLGWTIDAFDFFIVVFVISDIAHEFNASVTTITWAFTLTLALRAMGADIAALTPSRTSVQEHEALVETFVHVVRRLIAAVFKESFGRLKRVAFERVHATRFKFLFFCMSLSQNAVHPLAP